MNEKYDIIILGTGLKECILSGLLSTKGKKVLHIDKNEYYGGQSASFNLKQLYMKFKNENTYPDKFGDYRSYIVDSCPKFLMACGSLVKMLIHTKVTRYLDFKVIDGSFVYKDKKLYKMPSTPSEAISTNLMGFFQKRKLRNFLNFVEKFNLKDIKTQHELKDTMLKTFNEFGLDQNTIVSVGHALALQLDDSYLDKPESRYGIIEAIKLYSYSVQRYGNSPFIYPIYSLSGLPEGFARLSAVHGGIYMLNKPVDDIMYDEKGNVEGIKCGDEKAFCKQLLGSATYFNSKDYKIKEKIARWIFILSHPVKFTENTKSSQIIIPGSKIDRKSDVYLAVLSSQHKVCPENMFLAIASTVIETDNPKSEINVVKELLGEVEEEFYFETENNEPTQEFEKLNNGTFMTSGYDATTHFETVSNEVLELYERITGEKFDLDIRAEPEDVNN